MLELKPIVFIASKNRNTARAFYEEKLGLAHLRDDGFAHVFELGVSNMRLVEAADFAPQPFTVLGWETSSVAETKAEFEARGVVFEKYPFADPETGIWTMGNDQVAWFKDPDGNVLSISSHG